jgi:hypothetical protein
MASHFDLVREARVIAVKMSGRWAHLCTTTRPTPPAPMIRTLLMVVSPSLENVTTQNTEFRSQNPEILQAVDQYLDWY